MKDTRKPLPVEVSLHATEEQYSLGESIQLTSVITNPTGESIRICRYFTPIEGFKGNYLRVVNDDTNEKVPYAGMRANRKQPGPEAYFELDQGQSHSVTFDLNPPYSITKSGKYAVHFKGSPYLNQLPDSDIIHIRVE